MKDGTKVSIKASNKYYPGLEGVVLHEYDGDSPFHSRQFHKVFVVAFATRTMAVAANDLEVTP